MPDSPRIPRRLLSYLTYGLVATTLIVASQLAGRGSRRTPTGTDDERAALVEVDRFSARADKYDDADRLAVSFRVRAGVDAPMNCFVFIVAQAARGEERLWAIWPSQSPGMAISAGGYFHAAHPASGYPLALEDRWQRVNAAIPRTAGQRPFESVTIYVVTPGGSILLAHPFAL